ncbi:hypothetical protein K1Y82_04040 [Bacillus inaquosorum]|uniref:hypothetical protein n=1 Tax=Bacillus inaquosorum TaxID=483913 RepID=UPI000A11ABCE|nr:hypothetical protein [Bacillus inaquosorum]QJC87674.1 AAA family ATPase [Bacillus subtilis]QYX44237.1 hypothetical protein K1Y82_04040 [Bacillus inaquosorum]WNW25572.1 hypothetical protein RS399_06820 [Bacillus inaquosorum]
MGSLALKKVIYKGDKYYYSSKDLKMGIQIIEADNGAGKTTFSSLISYGLGMYVKQFDFRNDKEKHNEIYSDTNNYVLLKVLINGNLFELTRYFNPNNNNIIFVKGEDIEESFPINRNAISKGDIMVFSDWILNKLGIEVCDIYQGTRKFKINFSDLFRLIHYDQDTNPQKIYKEHRSNNNFVSDSVAVRKVIFELLVGYQFSEYYALIGEYNKIDREKSTHKATLDNYIEMVSNMGFRLRELNEKIVKDQLSDLNIQLYRLGMYRKRLKSNEYSSTQLDKFIGQLRDKYFDLDSTFTEAKSNKRMTTIELRNLLKLKEDIILEVTQIKKIILAHEELKLFSPNTCPCCLREVERQENHCICGNPIDENKYEKFLYNADEYLDILKSKQKSVETIETAIISCKEELDDLDTQITRLEIEREKIKEQLSEVEKNVSKTSNDSELNSVNDRILEVKTKILSAEQKLNIIGQYEAIEKDFCSSKNNLEKISVKLGKLEQVVKKQMEQQKIEFNKIYSSLLKKADNNVKQTELDENYMPVINNGVYRQASSYVARRFLYYLTLIKMSIDKNIPFPQFLLIDTPENLGIDEKNLIKCISLIDELFKDKEQVKDIVREKTEEKLKYHFQIILTTGIDKYPEKYKNYVVETLTEDNKLLKMLE